MTDYVYLSGMAKWARLNKVDPEFGDYKIVLYPDAESMKLFKESGMQQKVKSDEDGEFITIRRKAIADFGDEQKEMGPPKVLDDKDQPFTQLIGNGSEVICKVEVYSSKRGKGHRLVAVKVKNLVVYEGKGESAPTFKLPVGVSAF